MRGELGYQDGSPQLGARKQREPNMQRSKDRPIQGKVTAGIFDTKVQ